MPTKEQLEAELNATEKDKAIAKLRELFSDIDEWEANLRAAERQIWQPHWSHDDPLRDRLLRIGKSSEEVRELERRLDALNALRQGRPIPPDIKKEIDDTTAAEESALVQLAQIAAKRDRTGW